MSSGNQFVSSEMAKDSLGKLGNITQDSFRGNTRSLGFVILIALENACLTGEP